jgi:hypothetical protein
MQNNVALHTNINVHGIFFSYLTTHPISIYVASIHERNEVHWGYAEIIEIIEFFKGSLSNSLYLMAKSIHYRLLQLAEF